MFHPLKAWQRFFQQTVWQPHPQSRLAAWWYQSLQVLILAWQDLLGKGALVRTSALAYASILAIIPMLALLFAIFKGVGLQRLLAGHLLPQLAGGSQDFARQILDYVETTNVASLGVFGVIWLLVALMILMTNVEQAFNHIWKISRARPWWRKLSDYLSIFLLLPIVLAVAISLSTTFQSHPQLNEFIRFFLPETVFSAYHLMFSFAVVWLGFTFVYLVMPNTRVQVLSALLGGLTGGSIWQGAKWLFQWFQASAPYYNAIYGALYQILFLVIWMFWSWLIVLYGAEVAYVHQHLGGLRHQRLTSERQVDDDYLALLALCRIGQRFFTSGPPLSLGELEELLNGHPELAAGSIQALQTCGLIVAVAAPEDASPPGFVPSRPLDQIRLAEVLACLRQVRRQRVGRLLGPRDALASLILDLMESSGAPRQDLSLQEILQQAAGAGAVLQDAAGPARYNPTQV